jgi:hypothetical protein
MNMPAIEAIMPPMRATNRMGCSEAAFSEGIASRTTLRVETR